MQIFDDAWPVHIAQRAKVNFTWITTQKQHLEEHIGVIKQPIHEVHASLFFWLFFSQDEDVNDYDNKIRFPVTVKFEADVEITGYVQWTKFCWRYSCKFKYVDRQKIVVAQNTYMSLLFISRMPNMCAIPQLVSAPLNPIPNCWAFRRRVRTLLYGHHLISFLPTVFFVSGEIPYVVSKINQLIEDNGEVFLVQSIET